MRRLFILPITIMLLATSASAATIHVGVKGLVCAFCATGLEKTFKKEAAIESVKVDLESKLVTLDTKPKQDIDDATITKLITDAGFTITDIHRGK
jgi:copper chaperone CopZ